MTLLEVLETSLFLMLVVFLALCLIPLVPMLVKRRRGRIWTELMPHPGRFISIRLGIAAGLGAALFLIVTAALTLNHHRPPEGPAPVISVSGSAGRTDLTLDLDSCGEPAEGTIRVSGIRSGTATVTLGSEAQTATPVRLNGNGIGRFTLDDPTSKRSFLSCYLPLPVVEGGAGSSISLGLGGDMEVDTIDSIPPPSSYVDGRWQWTCPAGEKCGILTTADLDVEEGTQQIIVLLLAGILGAIIALFIGELLIEPVRRRLDRLKKD